MLYELIYSEVIMKRFLAVIVLLMAISSLMLCGCEEKANNETTQTESVSVSQNENGTKIQGSIGKIKK